MKTRFILTTFVDGQTKEIILKTANYNTERGIFIALTDIANGVFGKQQWRSVPDTRGFAGFYAVDPKTCNTIDANSDF